MINLVENKKLLKKIKKNNEEKYFLKNSKSNVLKEF